MPNWSARVAAAVVLCLSVDLAAAESPQEERLTLEQCPAAVQTALKQAAGDGVVKRVRRVTQGGDAAYVGVIEVTLDSQGRPREPIVTADPAAAEAAAAAASAAALARPVTLKVTATRLQDVCVTLTEAAGVPVSCGNAFASKLVTASFQSTPLGDVLKAIAEQTGTRADPREGGFRFRAGAR